MASSSCSSTPPTLMPDQSARSALHAGGGRAGAPGPLPDEVFGEALHKGLKAHTHDKRKSAALELKERVRQADADERDKMMLCLQEHFLEKREDARGDAGILDCKKGGLIGFAAIAYGLGSGSDIDPFIERLCEGVLALFSDEEARVRYYACESFHNIAKIAKHKVLVHLSDIYEGLCKLYADVDTEVRAGVAVLDRLMKDIVQQSPDMVGTDTIIPLLACRSKYRNPYVRQLVMAWVTLLLGLRESVDIVQFMPEYLEGLFNMLTDQSRDIRHNADSTLNKLLKSLLDTSSGCQMPRLEIILETTEIVVRCCSNSDSNLRYEALIWLHALIDLETRTCKQTSTPLHAKWIDMLPLLLDGALKNFDNKEDNIARMAVENNNALLTMAQHISTELPVGAVLERLKKTLKPSRASRPDRCVVRMDCLQWLSMLLLRSRDRQLRVEIMNIFGSAIFETLRGDDDEAVSGSLDVLALIMEAQPDVTDDDTCRDSSDSTPDFFDDVAQRLLELFKSRAMEETRWFVISHLCGHLDVRRLYVTVARTIQKAAAKNEPGELEFTQRLVQTFSWILFSAAETKKLRDELLEPVAISGLVASTLADGTAPQESQERPLFLELLLPWFHNPVSALALCLWAQQYEIATELAERFAALEPTLELLKQLDQLVHLLESPMFSRLRVQLLEPRKHPALLKCVLALAMLLPQAGAFNILRQRVCVVQSGLLLEAPQSGANPLAVSDGDMAALLERFDRITAAL